MKKDLLISYLKIRSLIEINKYHEKYWYLPKYWNSWINNVDIYLFVLLNLDDKYLSKRQKKEIYKFQERLEYLDFRYKNKTITDEEDEELTNLYRVLNYSVDDEGVRFLEYPEWCEKENAQELIGNVQMEYIFEGHVYHMSEEEIEDQMEEDMDMSSFEDDLPYDDYTPEGMGMDDYDEDNKRGP